MLADRQWQRYWKGLARTVVGLTLTIGVAIWVVDPYGNLPFSPPFERTPMATNQRYSYPAIARDADFDSAVLGTSTSRLLRPQALNAALGGRFVNLSMNSATAYEEARLFEVFAAAHPTPKTAIVGLDVSWCTVEPALTKYTFRRFPEWMYDDNAWNDIFHMLEFKTFEILGKQAGFLLGFKKAKYGHDGYAVFLPPQNEYDFAKVRQGLYDGPKVRNRQAPPSAPIVSASERAAFLYPSHALLRDMLAGLPESTHKVLYFVPYHYFFQPVPGSIRDAQWQECRNRIVEIAGKHTNTTVLDFMIVSPFTSRDENYWDSLHYTTDAAEQLVRAIAAGARGDAARDGEYVTLVDTVPRSTQ